MSRRGSVILALILALPALSFARAAAHPDLLVSTTWLAAHLQDPKVVVVQVASDDKGYQAAHIPGARLLLRSQMVSSEFPGNELLPAATLQRNLEQLGIGDRSRVIIYSPEGDTWAARLFFTLAYLGHDKAALLDGGLKQWQSEHRVTATGAPPEAAKGSLTIHPHPELVARLDEMRKLAADPGKITILDARAPATYRDGHLPNASSLFWEDSQVSKDDPILKSADDLRARFAQAGVAPGGKVVTYCHSGIAASYDFFLARYLGYKPRLYDGSFGEWSKAPDAPVVKGDAKK